MRWRVITTICGKELLETVRDRRTMIIMLFLPVVLYPVLLIGFSQIISHQFTKLENRTGRVMIVGKVPERLRELLREGDTIKLVDPEVIPRMPKSMPIVQEQREKKPAFVAHSSLPVERLELDPKLKDWARTEIARGMTDVIMMVPDDFETSIAEDGTGTAAIFYDETDDISRFVQGRLWDTFMVYRREMLSARKAKHPELNQGFDRPLFWDMKNVATAKRRGGYFAGRILPMMMIIMVMLGAFYPAVDLTAGEKERGTMQTLMTAPATAQEIIFGKFLAVSCISILSALANLGSMALAIVYLLESQAVGAKLNFQLDFSTGLLLLLQLVPVALLFSALMLAVSVFARSFKEAQNYLTPLYLLVIIPVVLTGLPGTELTRFTAWLPILNITLLIKEVLVESPGAELIAMVLIANTIYSIITLTVAVKIFKTEEILLGGRSGFSSIFAVNNRKSTPGLSFIVFSVGLVVFFYIGGLMQGADLFKGLVASQFLLLLLPVLVITKALKLNWRETLSLNLPNMKGIIVAVLLGCTTWAVLGHLTTWLQNLFLPTPQSITDAMKEMIQGQGELNTWLLIFVIGFTPAICEEFLFRGLILSGFRNGFNKSSAIITTAILFGVFHISIYKIMPTAVIGLVPTLIVWYTRSIWAGILFHFLHNSLAVLVLKHELFPGLTSPKGGRFDWPQFGLFILVFISGIALLLLTKDETSTPESSAGKNP